MLPVISMDLQYATAISPVTIAVASAATSAEATTLATTTTTAATVTTAATAATGSSTDGLGTITAELAAGSAWVAAKAVVPLVMTRRAMPRFWHWDYLGWKSQHNLPTAWRYFLCRVQETEHLAIVS
jgi:hypothetical protein